MHADCGYLRKAMRVVLWSGMAVGLMGMYEPTWSAPEPSTPASQDQPTAPPESSSSPGKGPEGGGLGAHPMRKACAEDVKKLCPGVKAGEGRIVQCLKEHTQELSQTCAEMMQQRGKRRQ